MNNKENLLGKTYTEILNIVRESDLPQYSAAQITDWLYKKNVSAIEEMTNLSKTIRDKLSLSYDVGLEPPEEFQLSSDGTKKYLFKVKSGKFIESVYIPEESRATLCISSQIGCKMGCVFCMTGKQGFMGNLTSGEIVNQIISLPEKNLLTNYVFMGMGEPLANTENLLKSLEIITSSYGLGISAGRITISTIGIIPGLEQVIDQSKCNLAVSLHSPFETERLQIMPVEKAFPVKRVIEILKRKSFDKQRKVSFEYIMFKGINDTARHVNGITRLLNGLRCRVNLIRYHKIPGVSLESSEEDTVNWFKTRLNEKGILTTIRASRGQDIFAACGMLSTKYPSGNI